MRLALRFVLALALGFLDRDALAGFIVLGFWRVHLFPLISGVIAMGYQNHHQT